MPEEPQLFQKVLKDSTSIVRLDDVHDKMRGLPNRNRRLATRINSADNPALYMETALNHFLDNLVLPYDVGETSSACLRLGKTLQGSVVKLLRWASNAFHVYQHRKYVALSILTTWAEAGLDLTECVLELLPRLDQESQVDCRAIGRIIAELARKGIFNAASALRWFIVNGSISGAAAYDQVCELDAIAF